MHRSLFRFGFVALLLIAVGPTARAAEARLLILHTNDFHDRLRPGAGGIGGLPYVASYVASVRAERSDFLLVNAGDTAEKGDLVAFRTHGELTYELMRAMRFDAVTLGNHDHDQGLPQMRRFEAALGQRFLCLNAVEPDGTPRFDVSRTVTVGPIKVGLLGLLVPQDEGTLDFAESGRRLAEEAVRLKMECHVVIAVCHHAVMACAAWSKMAPEVDVFVSGHSHEWVEKPFISPFTGVPIVQAGSYAKAVGRLELSVDLTTKKVKVLEGRLVRMDHQTVSPDSTALARVMAEEARLCPEASNLICENPSEIGREIAWLAAEGLRRQAGVEIGFCHPGHIIRDKLPAGPVDVNALFLTGGQRGYNVVRTVLSGAEILAYVETMAAAGDPTHWAGFALKAGGSMASPALNPTRTYTVVMPEIEWSKRFLRAASREKKQGPLGTRDFSSEPTDAHFTEALVALLTALPTDQRNLPALIAACRARAEGA